ncbi:MAG: alpha/beta fold hydrolase, partial [Polyangiales bacterium]
GPALLLLHGIFVDQGEWDRIVPRLRSHFRCIRLDLPGFGDSGKPEPGRFAYDVQAFSTLVADFVAAIGLGAYHLCGHSMGGAIALHVASQQPNEVQSLTLIDPLALPYTPPWTAQLATLPGLGEPIFRHLFRWPVFAHYFRSEVFHNVDHIDWSAIRRYYRNFDSGAGRAAAYAAMRSIVTPQPAAAWAADVKVPTLLLWGEYDRIFPLRLGYALQRILPQARIEIAADVGHSPAQEDPAWTATQLLAHHGPSALN